MPAATLFRRPIPAIVLVFVLAWLAAACGGPVSKSEYERRVVEIGRDARHELRGVVDGDAPPSAAQMRHAGKVFGEAAGKLDDIEPPTRVAKAHRHMEDGFRLLGKAFEEHAGELADASSDADRARVFVTFADDKDVRAAFADLTDAQREYRDAGYAKVLGSDDGGRAARSGTTSTTTG